MNPVVVAVLLVAGISVMGSGEYLREFSRYPYVINSYIYANDIRVGKVEGIVANGVAKTSPWVETLATRWLWPGTFCHGVRFLSLGRRAIARCENSLADGMQNLAARSCCTCRWFARPCRHLWAMSVTAQRLGGYLASLAPVTPSGANEKEIGQQVFAIHCAMCHSVGGAASAGLQGNRS